MEALRLVVVGVVLALLARAARLAWQHRGLVLSVWRRVRPRHVAGSLGLLTVVLALLTLLLEHVPGADWGLGAELGLYGNAVFAPVQEAAGAAAGGRAGSGAPWRQALSAVAVVAFLGALLAMLPWLAYAEERTFREGLETANLGRQVRVALVFGAAHLIMLIPLGAALVIGLAGFVYGLIYRRAYARARAVRWEAGPFGVPVVVRPTVAQARHEAVLTATVWHTAFNSLIVLTLLVGFVARWLVA